MEELPAAGEDKNVEAKFENGVLNVHVPKSEKVKPKKIKLSKLKNGKKVSVRLKDALAKSPVAGAEVTLQGCGVDESATTDDKGRAVFPAVSPAKTGVIVVTATKDSQPIDRRPTIRCEP